MARQLKKLETIVIRVNDEANLAHILFKNF